MPNKRYTLVLNFGYVESQSLSYMPWTSTKPYKDAKEALLDLATFLKEQYLDEAFPLNRCCLGTKEKDSEAEYCSKCGRHISEPEFYGDDFSDWLRMLNTDINTFHGIIEWNPDHRWQAGGLEGTKNQRFVYQAEWVLCAALGYPKEEGRTFETICKERTKSRKDSFTYY